MRRGLRLVLALIAVGLASGAPAARADLATYGYSNARTGALPGVAGITPSQATRLRSIWQANVGGAVTAQPLVLDRFRAAGRTRTLIVVATEQGALVALDGMTGRLVWRRQLGHRTITPDCDASPDGEFGVTGTPVADRRTGRVYAVDVDGRAWALELATGRVVPGWPRRVHPAGGDFVWGALALSRGRLYVPIASLCDAGLYHGGVVSVNVEHPAQIRRWLTTARQLRLRGRDLGVGRHLDRRRQRGRVRRHRELARHRERGHAVRGECGPPEPVTHAPSGQRPTDRTVSQHRP